jgi:hypothetical protein
MRRSIPWVDFILYGSMGVVGLVVSIAVPFTTDEIPAWISTWAAGLGFIVVALVVFCRWFKSQPDYQEDTYGVSIWHGGIRQLKNAKAAHKNLFNFFVDALPPLIAKHLPETAPERGVTPQKLSAMLYGARLEWSGRPVSAIGIGWTMKDKAGLQQGRSMVVHWNGSVAGSALFHELLHMVDDVILGIYDPKHERKDWWALVPKMKSIALEHWGVV